VRAQEVDGKKVYEITDAGRAFLDEHRDVVDDIFDRVREAVDQALGGGMAELNQAMGRLVRRVYRTHWRARSEEARRKITDVLRKAAEEIEALAE
jgi:DNA-binding PadR family transcriptional regulator